MNRSTEEFDDPVELPDGVEHCGATAYGRYKCRCRYCVTWRRLYDKARDAREAQARVVKRRGYRDYLAFRGIQVHGPGPFGRSPKRLAEMVADYLGDDLEAVLRGEQRSWR